MINSIVDGGFLLPGVALQEAGLADFRPWVDFDRPDADFVKKLALADFGILDFQMVHRQISSRF